VITADLLRTIAAGYALPLDGVHGLVHWARVLENGRRLAAVTGADPRVVELFAIFHDAGRRNEGHDPGHGRRGARLAAELRGHLFTLEDAAFAQLVEACDLHTDGHRRGDATVQTCWDADRLDLLRCRITPDPRRLATAAAREPAVLAWANDRARRRFEPAFVREVWWPALDGGGS
jgi:uncharacterized protein